MALLRLEPRSLSARLYAFEDKKELVTACFQNRSIWFLYDIIANLYSECYN